jgi:hypothetical protein
MRLTLALAIAFLAAATAQSQTAATVGAALTADLAQVDAATTAAATYNAPAIDAARDLAIAISNTQNAYADDLGHKPDGKLPGPLEAALTQLQAAIAGLATPTKASLLAATSSAQQIVTSLPFRPQQPHVTRIAPRFAVPAKEVYPVALHIYGSFELAAKPEYLPTLTLRDHTYKPISSTAAEIVFNVPIADLATLNTPDTHFHVVPATLTVPWQSTSLIKKDLMTKKHSQKDDTYKLYLGILPAQIGTVTLHTRGTKTEAGAPQKFASDPFHQCGTHACGGDDINHSWAAHPDPGCHVVKGTATFDTTAASGDWTKTFSGDEGDVVSYSVSTGHKGNKPGTVDFKIGFMEICPHEVADTTGQDIVLLWGDTRTLAIPPGAWSIAFDSFDGHHTDFTDASAANPLLKIATTPTSITLTTPDPATLLWP